MNIAGLIPEAELAVKYDLTDMHTRTWLSGYVSATIDGRKYYDAEKIEAIKGKLKCL